jgi:hypothetical protein
MFKHHGQQQESFSQHDTSVTHRNLAHVYQQNGCNGSGLNFGNGPASWVAKDGGSQSTQKGTQSIHSWSAINNLVEYYKGHHTWYRLERESRCSKSKSKKPRNYCGHSPLTLSLMLLMQCPEAGCNRKYKTKQRLQLHVQETHGKTDVNLDNVVTVAAKERNKSSRPIPIPAPAATAEATECCICLDASGGRAAATPCGHAMFCYDCIQEYFSRGYPCPCCRATMSGVIKLYQ